MVSEAVCATVESETGPCASLVQGCTDELISLSARNAEEIKTFLEGETEVINLAVGDFASPEATQDIFAILRSPAGWKRAITLGSLSLGKDGLSLSDISECVAQNRFLRWLTISVRN